MTDSAPGTLSRVRIPRPLLALLVLAVALRTGTWWAPNTLLGVMEYDDGVYYAASKLLLHGELPYRDFTIVHPPVLSVLLLPAALAGQVFGDPVGMATARVAVQLVAIANVVLIYLLALRLPAAPELARRAALVAAGLYAVIPSAVSAEHTLLLEPPVNLVCLAAVLLLVRSSAGTRRTALLSGALMAGATGIKLFAGAYLVAVVVWLVSTRQHRFLLPYVVGLAAGGALFVLPLVAAAPAEAWHDIVVTQLSRPQNMGVDRGLERLVGMLGLGYAPVVVGLALLAVVLAYTVVLLGRHWQSPLMLWCTVLLVGGVAVLGAPTYFLHYGAFLAPPLVLLLSRLVAFRSGRPRRDLARGVILAGIAAVFCIGVGAALLDQRGQPDLRAVGALVPAGSCVYFDAVSLALAADLYQDPSAGCPSWVDGRGVALTRNTDWPNEVDFYPHGFVADRHWQALNVRQMQHADFLLLRASPATFPEWAASTRSYVLSHFRPVWVHEEGRASRELWRRSAPG